MDELNSQYNQLKDWLDNFKDASEMYPLVKQSFEVVNFKKEIIDTLPSDLDETYKQNLYDQAITGAEYFDKNLKPIPSSPTFDPLSGLSLCTSGATGSISIVNDIKSISDFKYNGWADAIIGKYSQIQDHQDRKNFILCELATLDPVIRDEFEISFESYSKFSGDVGTQFDFAITCRNALEHLKGRLFAKARVHLPATVQKVNWVEMSNVLAKGGVGSAEHTQLTLELGKYDTLHSDLSHVAKNMQIKHYASTEAIFSQYLDHAFTLLSLIDKGKL